MVDHFKPAFILKFSKEFPSIFMLFIVTKFNTHLPQSKNSDATA